MMCISDLVFYSNPFGEDAREKHPNLRHRQVGFPAKLSSPYSPCKEINLFVVFIGTAAVWLSVTIIRKVLPNPICRDLGLHRISHRPDADI